MSMKCLNIISCLLIDVVCQCVTKMLSLEEAKKYMIDVFGILNVDELLSNRNKLEVITTINDAYREVEPYQNIIMLAEPQSKRRRPTWTEITANVKKRCGGMCFTHHMFLFEFYKALNFEVALVPAQVSNYWNHTVILFRNLVKPGDLYLIDEASAYPTFNPICLDFSEKSPIMYHSFLEYRYTKHNGSIYRMHRKGDQGYRTFDPKTSFYKDGWRKFSEFRIEDETKDASSLNDIYDNVFTNPNITPFHKSLRVIYFPGKKAKIICNKKVLLEVCDGELEVTEYESEDDLIKCINAILPMLGEELIRKALSHVALYK
ncbi:hypothetical protein LOTGIDRAFT_174273 [Lottia gigantea]|uniref:arylamine N-acetyltransferase n=1 Tax=Lottia gigantea TaxID=225164 RepID=V4C9N4_LOTGI|nr:hypothetical protein LOTGIDRAFT_174273 [Lottia gigantea]ESO98464.1 hypothetical protein LOTGIDRAFT_174273 [Lottia gigantea]